VSEPLLFPEPPEPSMFVPEPFLLPEPLPLPDPLPLPTDDVAKKIGNHHMVADDWAPMWERLRLRRAEAEIAQFEYEENRREFARRTERLRMSKADAESAKFRNEEKRRNKRLNLCKEEGSKECEECQPPKQPQPSRAGIRTPPMPVTYIPSGRTWAEKQLREIKDKHNAREARRKKRRRLEQAAAQAAAQAAGRNCGTCP